MPNLIRILLALFLPPVAVFFTVGVSWHLLLSIVLTILGFLPGMIHALWLIASKPAIA